MDCFMYDMFLGIKVPNVDDLVSVLGSEKEEGLEVITSFCLFTYFSFISCTATYLNVFTGKFLLANIATEIFLKFMEMWRGNSGS